MLELSKGWGGSAAENVLEKEKTTKSKFQNSRDTVDHKDYVLILIGIVLWQ